MSDDGPPHEQRTFDALQRLEQGAFQALGDRLLPRLFPQLVGLTPRGLNPEGKTRKGTPDSYVGDTPERCTAAVEYTTQVSTPEKKFDADYKSVRAKCLLATEIFLVTSRSLEGLDLSATENAASTAGIRLHRVDGQRLARALATEHQDLRKKFLGIDIDEHTPASLTTHLKDSLEASFDSHLRRVLAEEAPIRRRLASEAIATAVATGTRGIRLVMAPSGASKTTWSATMATGLATHTPTVWISARSLRLNQADPIGLKVVQLAYGSADPSRCLELAHLLRRERMTLVIWIDGIDEVNDYPALRNAFDEFTASQLAHETLVVCVGREEARLSIIDLFRELDFGRQNKDQPHTIELDPLTEWDRRLLLRRARASDAEIRDIELKLAPIYLSSPLFLTIGLRLLRSGSIPVSQRTFVRESVDYFAADIEKRSRAGGRALRKERIVQVLGEIAWKLLLDGTDTLAHQALPVLPDRSNDSTGENTFLAWAQQAGLVIERGQRIGFSHPAFLEELAARFVESDLQLWVDECRKKRTTIGGSRLAARLVPRMTDSCSAIRALQRESLRSALAAAAACEQLDHDDTVVELVESVRDELLSSSFASDVSNAVQHLGSIRHRAALAELIAWFNGLSQAGKQVWLRAAAEAFFTHGERGAIEVILWHPCLNNPIGWFEPTFIRELEHKPQAFLRVFRDTAAALIDRSDPSAPFPTRGVNALAMTRDERLIGGLRRALATRHLRGYEHRALIFMNTSEAIELYTESVDRVLETYCLPDSSTELGLWYEIVLTTSDITMFPHDALVDLVAEALKSSDWRHNRFGADWAERLADPSLIIPYTRVCNRYPSSFMSMTARLFEAVMERLPPDEACKLVASQSRSDIRRRLIHNLHHAPGRSTERLLIDALELTEHRFSAAQSLGLLRSYAAGPPLLRLLKVETGRTRDIIATALGRIRFAPALRTLERILASSVDDDSEYALVRAIGRIGGSEAWEVLEQFAPNARLPEFLMAALVSSRKPSALPFVRRIVHSLPGGVAALSSGLSAPDTDEFGQAHLCDGSWILDDELFDMVWSHLKQELGTESSSYLAYRAIATLSQFDGSTAGGVLRRLAGDDRQGLVAKDDVLAELRRQARSVLAARGDPEAARLLLTEELEHQTERGHVGWWDVRRLNEFDRSLVREALLERVRAQPTDQHWVYLLSRFSTSADKALFEELESSPQRSVAEIAHEHLVYRGVGLNFEQY